MADAEKWDQRYVQGSTPWDTHRPSTELRRVVREVGVKSCRALELGCGTGTNSVWLAEQGFDVTGLDISATALRQAGDRAAAAGVTVRFLQADVLSPPDLGEPFAFFFDRGCYHAVRREHPGRYAEVVGPLLGPGAIGLVLAGNAKEAAPPGQGPPAVTEDEIRQELGRAFTILALREFRFDAPPGTNESWLAWSCVVQFGGGE